MKSLCSILSKAHVGYLHWVRTSLKCCCSVLSTAGTDLYAMDSCMYLQTGFCCALVL